MSRLENLRILNLALGKVKAASIWIDKLKEDLHSSNNDKQKQIAIYGEYSAKITEMLTAAANIIREYNETYDNESFYARCRKFTKKIAGAISAEVEQARTLSTPSGSKQEGALVSTSESRTAGVCANDTDKYQLGDLMQEAIRMLAVMDNLLTTAITKEDRTLREELNTREADKDSSEQEHDVITTEIAKADAGVRKASLIDNDADIVDWLKDSQQVTLNKAHIQPEKRKDDNNFPVEWLGDIEEVVEQDEDDIIGFPVPKPK